MKVNADYGKIRRDFNHPKSGWYILTKNEYIISYDEFCTHTSYSTFKKLGNETAERKYSHIPKAVVNMKF